VHVGFLPEVEYRALLRKADVVVSTARHEYFGVAMVEAMAAGAVPLLPARLSYPEIVPDPHHTAVLYDDGDLRERLRDVLTDLPAAQRRVEGLRDALRAYDWSVLAPRYDDRWRALVGEHRGTRYGRRR
jgi:glycosyltransferase involved in cell wall biosynthesis